MSVADPSNPSNDSSRVPPPSSIHLVEPLPLQLSTVHRYPMVHVSPEFLVNNTHLISGGIVKISKASSSSKKKFMYAYLNSSSIISNPDNVAIDDLLRDNIGVKTSNQIQLEMAMGLPTAQNFDVAPLKEDLSVLGNISDNTNQFLYENYIKPYFTAYNQPGQSAMQPPLITLGQIFYPGNTSVKIGFKVVKIEPKVSAINDTASQDLAESYKGAVVIASELNKVFIDDPVEGKDSTSVRFEDIGGCESAKRQLRETIELPIKHPKFFSVLGIKPSRGVLLSGPPGTGKTLMGKALANELDCFFFLINGPEIMSKMAGDSESNLRKAFEEAEKNAPAIIFIDEIDSIAPKREKTQGEVEKRVVAQLLTLMDGVNSAKNVFVIGATNRPNQIEPALRRHGRFSPEIVIGVPDEAGRREILTIHTRNLKLASEINFDKIVKDTQGFVGADLAELTQLAAMEVCRENYPLLINQDEGTLSEEFLNSLSITQQHFEKATSLINPSALREVNIEIPNIKWSHIGGLEKVKQNLIQLIQWPILYPDIMQKFGLPPSSGVLFYGPPGCGKTLMAKAIATECKANFISVKGPEVLTMWYGESESNVRDVFAKAKQAAPCVIFFDEIDSICSTRGHSSTDSGVTDRVINTILTEMDGMGVKKNVFVICATNRPDILDPALLRPGRLDQVIYIPPPDETSRSKIISIALANTPVDKSVNIDELAKNTEGFSGADLTEICNAAIRIAFKEYMSKFDIQSESVTDPNKEIPIQTEDTQEFEGSVTREHFVISMSQARKSITPSQIQRYITFSKSLSSSSVNLPGTLGINNENGLGSGTSTKVNGFSTNNFDVEDDNDLYDA